MYNQFVLQYASAHKRNGEVDSIKPRKLGRDISQIYRSSQFFFDHKLKPYQLGSGQYILLIPLYDNDGINQKQLSDRAKLDKTTTTRTIEKLLSEGYITREPDESDKRAYKLYTTPKAAAIRPTLASILDEWNQIMLGGFTSEEREQIFSLIDKINSNIHQQRRRTEL